jgi:hypothetical protein
MTKLAAVTILPILGWIISAILAILIAMPLHFLWSWLAPTYLYFLPSVYLKVGFWDMAGMLVLIGFIKLIVFPSSFNAVVKSNDQ